MRDVAKSNMLLDAHPRSSSRPPLRARPDGEGAENPKERLTSPDFELIVSDPLASFRWHRHDYPSALARWNHHPEFEVHMITESTGKMFVGDHIGPFGPGNILLIGPNLPHHWVSDISPGQLIQGRDVALQFTGKFVEDAQKVFPEFGKMSALLKDSLRGIEFHGKDARECGELLLKIGASDGLARVALFVGLVQRMITATEKHLVAGETYRPEVTVGGDARIGNVIEYIFGNINDVRMSAAADIVGMNESTFSRHFKKMTGNNFVDCVRKIRIARACTLLESEALSVTDICFECGFQNISNFNRNFRHEKGMTPREYRSWIKMRRADRLPTNSPMHAPTRSHDDSLAVSPATD
jgi:AraC-like DNA-binding protein/mannose-6-phosphate isomerase-like protein (cupin superfamily)